MTVQNATFTDTSSERSNTRQVAWAPMANGDSGAPIKYSDYGYRSIQVFGTFGAGGTIVIEGSNDGTNWATLNDQQGVAMSWTSAKIKQTADNPVYMRPHVTAGDGTTLLTCAINIWKLV